MLLGFWFLWILFICSVIENLMEVLWRFNLSYPRVLMSLFCFDTVEFWSMFSPLVYFQICYFRLSLSSWSAAATGRVYWSSRVFLYWTCSQGTSCKCEAIVNMLMSPPSPNPISFYSIFAECFSAVLSKANHPV